MEKRTTDVKRGVYLPVYYEADEKFTEPKSPMLRLMYVTEGNGIIKLNGQAIIFSAPSLFCLNEQDEVVLQQGIRLAVQTVYFNPIVINNALEIENIRKKAVQLSLSEHRDFFLIISFMGGEEFRIPYIELGPMTSKRVANLFNGMKEELTGLENEYWACRFRSCLFEALFLIQNMITDSKNRENIELPKIEEEMSDIILHLHTNYNNKVTIEELTEIFHMNRTTLSEKFRKSTGISIIEYLVRLRVKMASIMLRDTYLPVSEILNRVGFNDSVHFSRTFKKHMGCTPSDYRDKYLMK